MMMAPSSLVFTWQTQRHSQRLWHIGGERNQYFVIKNKTQWRENFEAWLKEVHVADEISDSDDETSEDEDKNDGQEEEISGEDEDISDHLH